MRPARSRSLAEIPSLIADAILDRAVLAFALWTLVYDACLAIRAPVEVAAGLWVLALPVAFWLLRRGGSASDSGVVERRSGAWREWLFLVAAGLAAGSALLIASSSSAIAWWSAWVLAVGAVGLGLAIAVAGLRKAAASLVRDTNSPGSPGNLQADDRRR